MYENEVLGTGFIDRIYRIVVPRKAREFTELEGRNHAVWFVDENDLCVKFFADVDEVEKTRDRYEVLDTSTMDSKYRLVVPKKIRNTVGLTTDDQVVWYTDGFNLCVKFLSARDMHRLLVAMDREGDSYW